jgi:hypothetical protein
MDSIEEARCLAALAGIRLSGERETALAAGIEGMRRIAEALGRREYGEAEPACHFRPPLRTGQ